ncbi:hypothetical protein QL093DRAFT_2163811 [Fusarium oxysporum]|nr:hypothetical protein QL093DRAFT_2163811 [Fusarium oxysporum]
MPHLRPQTQQQDEPMLQVKHPSAPTRACGAEDGGNLILGSFFSICNQVSGRPSVLGGGPVPSFSATDSKQLAQ